LHEGGGVGDVGHFEDDRGGGGVAGGFGGERGGVAEVGALVGGGAREVAAIIDRQRRALAMMGRGAA
jgi:hypothetical protein